MASRVLKIQTNKNGLCGPIQLTSEKLPMRIMTPIISIGLIYFKTKSVHKIVAWWRLIFDGLNRRCESCPVQGAQLNHEANWLASKSFCRH